MSDQITLLRRAAAAIHTLRESLHKRPMHQNTLELELLRAARLEELEQLPPVIGVADHLDVGFSRPN
jgi:hypothetical protein